MKTKQKLILCSVLFFVGLVINIFFSTAFHSLLSGESSTLKLYNLIECISSMATSKQHILLFLCFQLLIAGLCIFFYISNPKSYQSQLFEVTPDIKTPIPIGQYQHGSAKWLSNEEKESIFDSSIISVSDKKIQELIKTGYDDLDFLKYGNKENKPERSDLPDTQDTEA